MIREGKVLSLPTAEIRSSYDVVVIGSGYGGSIAASRMARAGKSVCLLEKGREFRPGDFPATELEAVEEMQFNRLDGKRIGDETGLYNFQQGDGINIFWGCGLGGTSLVNANVSLKADPRVFDDASWPAEFRNNRTDLNEGYCRAWEMLQPQPYPDSSTKLLKLESLEKSAKGMGENFYRVPINVTFKSGKNRAGVYQEACNGCGDCVTGCNYGSKNTLAMNYLPDAFGHGAHIFTQMEVLYIEKEEDDYLVHYRPLGHDREEMSEESMFVRAPMVFVSAGALGSTEIMLRSKEKGLPLSETVGKKFTGNGDVLAFAYNCDQPINSIGWGLHKRQEVGPCITGVIDMRDTDDFEKGMVIEEGASPSPISAIMPISMAAAAKLGGKDTDSGIPDHLKEMLRETQSLMFGSYHGAIRNTQVYLVMSHDSGDGRIEFEDNKPRLIWPEIGEAPHFDFVGEKLLDATTQLGGTYIKNPISSKHLGEQLITVHPLGGCVMGENAASGVVDHKCRAFTGGLGGEVHEGLYIADGSVIPRPLGVNPLITISAVAERTCAIAARDRGWNIDYEPRDVELPEVDKVVGIEFTETMRGAVAQGATEFEAGGENGNPFEFTFTIWVDDLDSFLSDPDHTADMFGTVEAPDLSAEPITVSNATFNLFADDPERPEAQRMIYEANMVTKDGRKFFLEGFKSMEPSPVWKVWGETSTLYLTVYEGTRRERGDMFGKGVLRIETKDFIKQLGTMRAVDASSIGEAVSAVARFGKFFAGEVFDLYGGAFSPDDSFDPSAPARKKRKLRVPQPEVHPVKTSDDVAIRLTRYYDGSNNKGPVMLAHGLGVSSKIFSTDTIDTNLLEFLYAHGYDVWLLDFRQSIALPASKQLSTGDDVAGRDFPAAVKYIRDELQVDDVQVVAHCFGGTAFLMSLLKGLEGVRSAVVSQAGLYPLAPAITRVKCGLHTAQVLDALGVDDLTAYTDENAGWLDRLFNIAVDFQPVAFDERCNNDVCHRITFIYSLLYEHDKLNDLTHDNLHEMFGIANIDALKHLGTLVRKGHLVDANGNESYMPNIHRANIPITWIHGSENDCFLPEGTARTYETMVRENGPELYARHVIPGYGHIDCIFGRDAAQEVYPTILTALEPHSETRK